jgi:hypothetical protein
MGRDWSDCVAFSLKTKPQEPYSPVKARATGSARRFGAPVTRHMPGATHYTSYVSIWARCSLPE